MNKSLQTGNRFYISAVVQNIYNKRMSGAMPCNMLCNSGASSTIP